jgi:hypothetical protein
MTKRRARVGIAVLIGGVLLALLLTIRHSRGLQHELDNERAVKRRQCLFHGMALEQYRRQARSEFQASRTLIDAGIQRCVEYSVAMPLIDQLTDASTPGQIDAAFAAARKAIDEANSD